MNKNPSIWQIAAGEQGRYYDDIFIKHNIMFMGPGNFKEYNENYYFLQVSNNLITDHKKNQIRRFVNDLKEGDIVLLRKGYAVTSIGLVASEGYHWDNRFDDVYGWDLQHTRRVVWQNNIEDDLKRIQEYNDKNCDYAKPLFGDRKQIPTFTAVSDSSIIKPIIHLFDKLEKTEVQPLELSIPKTLSLDVFGEMLFGKGLANDSVDQVIEAIKRQRRLGKWYATTIGQKRPTEHEVVAYMILPLMLGLGWSEQLLAVEWNKVDLAGFSSTPTTNDKCILVCEAKQMSHPLLPALEQAKRYVTKLKLDQCKRILLTDGLRVYLYERKDGGFDAEPSGYINVNLLRTNHLAPKDTNAVDTLMKLNPQSTY